MQGPISRGIAIATLIGFAAPQAGAIELFGAPTQMNDGFLHQVRAVRGGARHGGGTHRGGGVHHGMNRGNLNRGAYAHRGNFRGAHANRNVYRAGASGNWARPSGYYWPIGGAVAAGAALGFVSAAAAASWAGAAPGPNLCWYYTDPSRRAGFWDACP